MIVLGLCASPPKINRLDDEAQRWTDSVDILVHKLLNYSGLSRIIESSAAKSVLLVPENGNHAVLQHQDTHLLVLQPGFAKDGEHNGLGRSQCQVRKHSARCSRIIDRLGRCNLLSINPPNPLCSRIAVALDCLAWVTVCSPCLKAQVLL